MLKTIIEMLKKMGEDVEYQIQEIEGRKPLLIINIIDCTGFDENDKEIMREYDSNAVNNLVNWLEEHNLLRFPEKGDDLYSYYYLKDCVVHFGYSSYEI